MTRRIFLGMLLSLTTTTLASAQKRVLHKYRIKYKTKPRGSVIIVVREAYNEDEAKAKLRKLHPECVILSVDFVE